MCSFFFFFFQAEDGIRDVAVTGVQTCALPISRARNGGTITAVDANHIVIDNADEYVLRKFVGLNEKTCLNQKPIVKLGAKIRKGQIIADGAGTFQGELALGKNVMVAFNTFDGYNFE